MELSAEILRALADVGADLFPLNGVNGFDIGLDEAGVLAVRILVPHPDEPPAGLPSLGDLPVIVVYGSPYLETTPVIPDAARHDPVLGCHQVGRHDTYGGLAGTGTLGCVLRDSGTGQPVAIGNAHVLGGTPGSLPYAVGDVIQQPAPSTLPPSSLERLGERVHERGARTLETAGRVSGISRVYACTRVRRRGRPAVVDVRTDHHRRRHLVSRREPRRRPVGLRLSGGQTRITRSSACTTRAMTPPVTPVTSRRWRPRPESPCEMRAM
ncbi:hypothetical protein ACQPZP_27265 [Spirillospora sp. CA-142024]|uniref:hypothetical protein n=1 Tax=Spirillospora sp. CA-142024 TaxID=3240036 RepID=UPI003D941F78